MALMTKTMFEGFADRIAKQYSYFKVCFTAVANTAEGENYYNRITMSELPDVEINMLASCKTQDDWSVGSSTLVNAIRSFTSFTNVVKSFETALRADGTLTSKTYDGFCESVSTKVSDYTNQVYFAANSVYMYSHNVWCEDTKVLATGEMTGATTLAYTAGDTLYAGTYSATQRADGTHFGAVGLKVVIGGSQTISSLVVDVTGRNALGVTQTVAVTISGAPAVEVNVGTSEVFLDVTNISRTSGGTTGDVFTIVNKKDRVIAL